MIELKILMGVFLTFGITGAVIGLTMGSFPSFLGFAFMACLSGIGVYKL